MQNFRQATLEIRASHENVQKYIIAALNWRAVGPRRAYAVELVGVGKIYESVDSPVQAYILVGVYEGPRDLFLVSI
jgi:hypothetical protein